VDGRARTLPGRVFPWVASVLLLLLVLKGIAPALPLPPALLSAFALVVWGLLGAVRSRAEPSRDLFSDPGVRVLVGVLGLFAAILLSRGDRLSSDGYDHFVYLRSLWIDHDLDLANDYAVVSPRGRSVDPPTPIGRTGNVHPVGPAIAWAPLYLLADLLCRLTGHVPDGQNELYRNGVALAGLLYGWLGLLVLYRTCEPRAGRGPALLATLGIATGTFLFFYLVFAPTMAHAPGFGAVALVLALWLRGPQGGWRGAALLGAAIGWASLMRWSNGILLVLPAVELGWRALRGRWRIALVEGAVVLVAAALIFSPQMIVWKLLYGSFLTIPQGGAFLGRAPAFGGVLFSAWHGLFSWSPLLYLGALGLVPFVLGDPLRGLASLLFLFLLLRVNAATADWWGGAAFGARRFDSALPFLGLGLALALQWLLSVSRRHPLGLPAVLVGAFVAWNLCLAVVFRSGVWDYAEPVTFEEMGEGVSGLVDRTLGSPLALPGSLVAWLVHGTPPRDYDAAVAERRHGRFKVLMGVDDRLYLEGAWSQARVLSGEQCRLVGEDSALVVPLHRAEPYRLGMRLLAADAPPSRLRVLVNDVVVGSLTPGPEWADLELSVPQKVLRPGRNLVAFRPLGSGPAVAGVWLEPEGRTPTAAEAPR
jgi:hypothetical protein